MIQSGADNAQISASYLTGQSSDLHIRQEFSSESFFTSTSSSSEPSVSSEALGSHKVNGAAGREGRFWVNHPSRVTHIHTVHTGCTDCTQEQVLSQVSVCRQSTVQAVQYFRFFSGKLSTNPLTQNDATSYKRTKTLK